MVKKGTTIGANATIVCGTTLGKYSFIGAGAVVTHAGEVRHEATRDALGVAPAEDATAGEEGEA